MGCNASKKEMKISDPEVFYDEDVIDERTLEGEGPAPTTEERPLNAGKADLDVDSVQSRRVTVEEKPKVSVPSVLTFDNDTGQPQTQPLYLQNEEAFDVFFKVKVTHPRQFMVNPSAGRMNPNDSVTIKVKYVPTTVVEKDTKIKLMIQALQVKNYTDGDRLPQSMWLETPKTFLSTSVIKVEFTEHEEVDLSKFMSVTMSMDNQDKKWWN